MKPDALLRAKHARARQKEVQRLRSETSIDLAHALAVLHDIAGMSHAEIAEEMGLSRARCSDLVHQGRKYLTINERKEAWIQRKQT